MLGNYFKQSLDVSQKIYFDSDHFSEDVDIALIIKFNKIFDFFQAKNKK